jgi:hypothetical protein
MFCNLYVESEKARYPAQLNDKQYTMATIKSVIISDFSGWTGNTIFELQNGQIWKQAVYQYKYFYIYRPHVIIESSGNRGVMTVNRNSIKVERIR